MKQFPNYLECPIIPDKSELFDKHNDIDLKKFCRRHTNPYKSVDEYLERQFYLLREDCFLYLKKGIRTIRANKYPDGNVVLPDSNLWIYNDVFISEFSFNSFDVVYRIRFKRNDKIEWKESKQLRFGSLLLLSSDQFNSCHVATVAESNAKDLQNGWVTIRLVETALMTSTEVGRKFVMLEMQVYYESYVHVLRRLQALGGSGVSFPFPEYILYGEKKTQALEQHNRVVLSTGGGAKVCRRTLNPSQKAAYECAVTKTFSIVQGPPGTGKTTVGTAVVSTILTEYKTQYGPRGPVLVVCYTNHALDQFLETIIDMKVGGYVVRLGSQSDSDKVRNCNINVLVSQWKEHRKFPKYISYRRMRLRNELTELRKGFQDKTETDQETLRTNVARYGTLVEEYNGLGMEEHQMVMESAAVVGMTTTACCRYADVLDRINIRVMMIEEAAEILEAHVVCSISKSCQQLIMIGDHKQLQPSPAVYDFCDTFDLDCSLFERLVDTGFEFVTLKQQCRMRPEISRCLKPIYPELEDGPNVLSYGNVDGMRVNVYFFDHDSPEKLTLKTSYKNEYEATFVVGLCRFLLERNVNRDKITVLTTYKGQNQEIRNKLKDHSIGEIKICVVDNYQGEENDIIILSLVRSNGDGKIGYLKKANRICVALSRARKGLFMVGNLRCLVPYKLWLQMSIILDKEIGRLLPVKCKRNPNHQMTITHSDDLFNDDLCREKCGELFHCQKHYCQQTCHDGNHTKCTEIVTKPCQKKLHKVKECCSGEVVCKNMIKSRLDCGHYAQHMCHTDKPLKCTEHVDIELRCSHAHNVICGTIADNVVCERRHEQVLACGHSYIDCVKYVGLCNRDIVHQLSCGHMAHIKCYQTKTKVMCFEDCTKRLVCGHTYRHNCEECDGGKHHKVCKEIINHKLPCQHMKPLVCSLKEVGHACGAVCSKKMQCGHICKHICEDCARGNVHKPCNEIIDHPLICQHKKTIRCSERDSGHVCYEICAKKMSCGHICKNVCKDCHGGNSHKPCDELVDNLLPCLHKIIVKCATRNDRHICFNVCSKGMSCRHICKNVCKDCDGGQCHLACKEIISHQLPCGHVKTIKCSEQNLPQPCDNVCSKRMTCGHSCKFLCRNCDGGKIHQACMELVSHQLPCQHIKSVKCSERGLVHACDEACLKVMECGHTYDHSCKNCEGGQIHKACMNTVLVQLQCTHLAAVNCSEKHLPSTCYDVCSKRLPCGHQCKSVCHTCDGGTFHNPCRELVKRKLRCGHKALVKCSQKDSEYACSDICYKLLLCGHRCNHQCADCDRGLSHKPCKTLIDHLLKCNHTVSIKCSDQNLKHACADICQKKLTCGHNCLSLCGDCLCGRLHKPCTIRCEKIMSCGHRCKDVCHSGKCKKCTRRCFITTVNNYEIFSTRKVSMDVVQKWITLKDSLDNRTPHFARKILSEIVTYLMSTKCHREDMEIFHRSYVFYEKLFEFYNETFLSENFNILLEYKEHILNSVCKIMEYLNPLSRGMVSTEHVQFEMEFERIKDLAFVCQLHENANNEAKIIYDDILKELVDSSYDETTRLTFKLRIVS